MTWDVVTTMGAFVLIAAVVLAFAVIVLARTIAFARSLRRSALDCHRCGYNLVGNESGVCPECGTPVPR